MGAKQIATEFCEDVMNSANHKNECKRLWLIIARHVVDKVESENVSEVLAIINESQVLSIEDILPHLKDFTEIGPFKKDIKASLEKYSQQIVKLQKEMDNYTDNAEEIRRDTDKLLLRSSMITSNRKCDLSGKPILNTQFILFPCTHIFRLDALTERIVEYKKQIGDKRVFENNEELIQYASSQCALCGDMMIDQVCRPFIDFDDAADLKEAEAWHVGDSKFSYDQSAMIEETIVENDTRNKTLKGKSSVLNLEDI